MAIKKSNLFIYISTLTLSLFIYIFIKLNIAWEAIQIIKLTQTFAIVATAYLYLTLLATPFCTTFITLPITKYFLHAKKALGVSAFYFGLLHALYAFFGQLGGFEGLRFLDAQNLFLMSLGFVALLILALFAASTILSIDNLLFKKWKIINKLLYVAGLLVIYHAVMMRVHFADLSSPLSLTYFFAIVFLLLLEAGRVDAFLERKLHIPSKLNLSTIIVLILAVYFLSAYGPWANQSDKNMNMEGVQLVPVEDK